MSRHNKGGIFIAKGMPGSRHVSEAPRKLMDDPYTKTIGRTEPGRLASRLFIAAGLQADVRNVLNRDREAQAGLDQSVSKAKH